MLNLYCHQTLNNDQVMELSVLDAGVTTFKALGTAAEHILTVADGLVLLPNWFDDNETWVLVKLAEAIGIPVKPFLVWLQTLPDPGTADQPFTARLFAGEFPPLPDHLPQDFVDLETGDVVFDEMEPSAHYAIDGHTVTQLVKPDDVVFEPDGGWEDATPPPNPDAVCPAPPAPCKHIWTSDNGVQACEECGAVA